MNFLIILCITFLIECNGSSSQKYLLETIKDLKSKTTNRNSLIAQYQPSLNTINMPTMRRVYQNADMQAFGQSHDAISAEVDKIMDNMAAAVSSASDFDSSEKDEHENDHYTQQYNQQHQINSQNALKTPGSQTNVPPLHLTKAELASLYANAVHKGDTIKLDGSDTNSDEQPLTAAVHEVDDGGHLGRPNLNAAKHPDNGYYYYYYPLKSFMDEMTSAGSSQAENATTTTTTASATRGKSPEKKKSVRKNGQFQSQATFFRPTQSGYHQHHPHHSHHDPYYHWHQQMQPSQHNVHISPPYPLLHHDNKKKGLEPLFMAISGFIGMTVMFILSVLVLPKFKKMKPKTWRRDGQPVEEEEEFYGIGRVALEAIEGYDCTERFACEAGKAANAFGLYHNRFVKLFRRIGPVFVVKEINKIGKYTNKKYRCAAIRCKEKGVSAKPPLTLT